MKAVEVLRGPAKDLIIFDRRQSGNRVADAEDLSAGERARPFRSRGKAETHREYHLKPQGRQEMKNASSLDDLFGVKFLAMGSRVGKDA